MSTFYYGLVIKDLGVEGLGLRDYNFELGGSRERSSVRSNRTEV